MIAFKSNEDGTEMEIETNNDPAEVERMLRNVLQPETYARLKREVLIGEEIFFEFTGVNKEEMPLVRHYLVHLDRRPRGTVNLTTGDFYIYFRVHKDKLPTALKMAKVLKSRFKNINDWQETTEHGIEAQKFFQIPPANLK
jgi:hypothetical protein